VLLFLAERRLPLDTQRTGRRALRIGAGVAASVMLAVVAVLVVAGVIAVEVLRALF
jgi:hypothetical protein